jgi:RNA polymerase sigma factor (sigma-70 family)
MFKKKILTDSEIISGLYNFEKNAENAVYMQHQEYTMAFMNKLHTDVTKNEELYTDAVMVFIQKLRHANLELHNTSIQTYLNSICRYQILDRFKKTSKEVYMAETDYSFEDKYQDWYEEDNTINHKRIDILVESLNNMQVAGEKCYELLNLFYFKKMNQSQIATQMGYGSADTVKNQNKRCKEKLETLIKQHANYE